MYRMLQGAEIHYRQNSRDDKSKQKIKPVDFYGALSVLSKRCSKAIILLSILSKKPIL